MSLNWVLDSQARLIVATADGDVGQGDFEAYLRAVDGAKAFGWSALIDIRSGRLAMGEVEILTIGVQLRALQKEHGTFGPLAIVISPDEDNLLPRLLGFMAMAKHPMRIFRDIKAAHRWLRSPPKMAPGGRPL